MQMEVNYDSAGRAAYQPSRPSVSPRSPRAKRNWVELDAAQDIKVLIAVATKNGVINEHFGHAKEFQVYELSASSASSSAIAVSISIARAVSATSLAGNRDRGDQRIATRCSSPRSAAAPRPT